MKNSIGNVLVAFGLWCVFSAVNIAKKAENLPELIGMYFPGILLVGVGIALRNGAIRLRGDVNEDYQASRERRRALAETAVIGGITLMFVGSGVSQLGRDWLLPGLCVLISGWLLTIWGAARYMLWKGYSTWFGLFGLLLLPGIIVLALLPRRTGRIIASGDGEQSGEDLNARRESRSAVPVVLTSVVMIGGLCAMVFVAGPRLIAWLPRAKPATPWNWLAVESPKFSVFMPGNRNVQNLSQETPRGTIDGEMYQSSDNKITFTVVYLRNASGGAPPQEIQQLERALDQPLNNWMLGLKGNLVSQRSINAGENHGRELTLEFSPGDSGRAGRPIVGRGIGRAYLFGDALVTLNAVCDQRDYQADPVAMEATISRFFDSLQVE